MVIWVGQAPHLYALLQIMKMVKLIIAMERETAIAQKY